MGLREEAVAAAINAGRAVRGVAEDGFRTFNDWQTDRQDARHWAEVDADIEKAAKDALKNGLNDDKKAAGFDTKHLPAREGKALHYDPFDLVAAMGYRERPSAFTFQAMEMIGRGVPVIADIITTRVAQVCMFTNLPEDRHSPGFKVRLKDWRNVKPNTKTDKRANELEQILLTTGYQHPKRAYQSMSFEAFTRNVLADSLIYDQMCFEVIPDKKGDPSYITPVDPSTIRLIDPGVRKPEDPFAVQTLDGAIVADFTRDELAFCIRNPRTGIKSFGYGLSELETLVREITGFLWGMEYNRKFFSQGSATKGILNFKGTIPDKQLKAFKRQWYAMIAGVANAWRTPITNAEELQWINMQMSNRDMEYSAWMDFLIKISCARYLIAPEEVNFSYGNTGQSNAMGQNSTEEKLKASQDLGLRPLVRWYFEQLNTHFLSRIDPDYEVVPVGLDEKGPEAEADLLAKQQGAFMTINEARERVELEPLDDDQGGNVILNPNWLQYVQGKEGQEEGGFDDPGSESGEAEEDFADPDEDGDEDDGPKPFLLDQSDEDEDEDVDAPNNDAIKSESDHYTVARYTVDLPREE